MALHTFPRYACGLLAFAAIGAIGRPGLAYAPMWLGTDNTSSRNALGTDLSGNVLVPVGPLEATGFAIDAANNVIYFGSSLQVITPRDLSNPSLTTGPSFTPDFAPPTLGEDMTFLGGKIWRTYANGTVTEIDPATGHVTSSFNVGFEALGITAYNGDLLISSSANQRVMEYTTAGGLVAGGVNFLATDGVNPLVGEIGGLGLDAATNTIYLGYSGQVFHYKPDGTFLGSFNIPASQSPGRFVDGLEISTPEPSTLALFGVGAVGLLRRARRSKRHCAPLH